MVSDVWKHTPAKRMAIGRWFREKKLPASKLGKRFFVRA